MALFKTPVRLLQPSAEGHAPSEYFAYARRVSDVSGAVGEFDGALTGSTSQVWEVDVGGTAIPTIGTRWRIRIAGESYAIEAAYRPRQEFAVWRLVLEGSALTGDLAP